MKKRISGLLLCLLPLLASTQTQVLGTFDNLALENNDTFWNGADGSGEFNASGYVFKNSYNPQWKSWSGFAYSNRTDSATAGHGNQFSCFDQSGANGTNNFAIGNGSPKIILPKKMEVTGMYVNNSTYAALSMKNGDQFAKKFGGETGDDPDWFKLKAYGYANGQVADSAEIMLADFTSKSEAGDYILNKWTWFDLSGLGEVDSIQFGLSSTDVGQHGMNTPAYFCMDDFNGIGPEKDFLKLDFNEITLEKDSFYNGSDTIGGIAINNYFFPNHYNTQWNSWSGWAFTNMKDTVRGIFENQYSARTGSGYMDDNYAVAFGNTSIRFGYSDEKFPTLIPEASIGMRITNTTYAYETILKGNRFSKKFGGATGDDKDYFLLNIVGKDITGNVIDTVKFYLADYRFDDNSKDFIVKDWVWVDLSKLVNNTRAVRIEFSFESTDVGQHGINTPQYFCMDNFMDGNPANINRLDVQQLSVYPNPSRDYVHLQSVSSNAEIRVYDVSGKSLDLPAESNVIDIRNLKSGIYFIEAIDGDLKYNGKFIKQ